MINNIDVEDLVNQPQPGQPEPEEQENKEESTEKSENELTFKDLKYTLWCIKCLTVVKILPTEMDIKSGLLRKNEGKKMALHKFLHIIPNIFVTLRLISMVLVIIWPKGSSNQEGSESESGESEKNTEDIKIHRLLLNLMLTIALSFIYVGYFSSVVLHMPTLTVMMNGLIQNLNTRRAHQLQNKASRSLRIKKFLLSLIKRPFQVNLIIHLPFLVYTLLPMFAVLAVVDQESDNFLISFLSKSNMSSGFPKFLLYCFLAILDCFFYSFVISCGFYITYTLLIGFIVIRQDTQNAITKIQSLDELEEAKKTLEVIKLQVLLYNLVTSTVTYMGKLTFLSGGVIAGFCVLKMKSPLFVIIYSFFFMVAVILHTSLFDRVFRIPEKIEELKEKIIIMAQNGNFRDEGKKKEYKKFCRSVQRLGIQAGGFYVMERETTLMFADFLTQKIVDLLLMFQ